MLCLKWLQLQHSFFAYCFQFALVILVDFLLDGIPISAQFVIYFSHLRQMLRPDWRISWGHGHDGIRGQLPFWCALLWSINHWINSDVWAGFSILWGRISRRIDALSPVVLSIIRFIPEVGLRLMTLMLVWPLWVLLCRPSACLIIPLMVSKFIGIVKIRLLLRERWSIGWLKVFVLRFDSQPMDSFPLLRCQNWRPIWCLIMVPWLRLRLVLAQGEGPLSFPVVIVVSCISLITHRFPSLIVIFDIIKIKLNLCILKINFQWIIN